MKYLITLSIAMAFLCSCSKSSEGVSRTLQIKITNISGGTTFNFSLKNSKVGSPQFVLDGSTTGGDYTVGCNKGMLLNISYFFNTPGFPYGQGNVEILMGSQSLLKINGGNGTNSLIVP